MANAKRDNNYVQTLIGVSNADVSTPTLVYVDPATGRLLVNTNTTSIQGTVAHDSAVADNPLQVAGEARSSERTAVANADVSRLITDLTGKLIILPYANPEIFLRGREETIAAGGTNQLIAAQGASTRIYVSCVMVSNASTTDTTVHLQEGGSTILATLPAPAAGGTVINFAVPIRLTENTTLGFDAIDAASTITVTALGYSGV